MRVASGQLSQMVLQGLQRQDSAYAKVMTQMSSGYRINTPSDDPLASITLLGLGREQSSFTQFRDNASRLISRLEKAESYLHTSNDVLLRVQDLTLAALNGSATQADREASVNELKNLRDALLDFANAVDEDGNYLFSGSLLGTAPIADSGAGLAYQGDSLQRGVPVSNGVTIAANITADSLYFSDGNDFFAALNNMIDDIENNGSATLATNGPALLTSLTTTQNRLGQQLTELGSRITRAQSMSEAQEDLTLANEKIRGKLKDLDYVEAAMTVNKIELALSTTQKTYSRLSQLSLFDHI